MKSLLRTRKEIQALILDIDRMEISFDPVEIIERLTKIAGNDEVEDGMLLVESIYDDSCFG